MKQLLSTYVFSSEDFTEESLPITEAEFKASLGLVIGTLAIFGFIVHVFGS